MQGVVKRISYKELDRLYSTYRASVSLGHYVKYIEWPATEDAARKYLISHGFVSEEDIEDLTSENIDEEIHEHLDVSENVQEHLYISTSVPHLYLVYMLTKEYGVFESIEVADFESDNLTTSFEFLQNLVQRLESYGVAEEGKSTKAPGRFRVQIESGIDMSNSRDSEEIVAEIESRLSRYSDKYIASVTGQNLYDVCAYHLYLEGSHDYIKYREINQILTDRYGCSVLYSNLEEFDKYRKDINLELSRAIFSRILKSYKNEEIYTIGIKTPFVEMLTMKGPEEMPDGTTQIVVRSRKTYNNKHWYIAARNLYQWIMDQPYTVYLLDPELYKYDPSDAFFAALAMVQVSKDVRILISGDKVYKDILSEMISLDFVDLTTRIAHSQMLYAKDTLRVLTDFNGSLVLGWIKGCTLNINFNVMELSLLAKYIRKVDKDLDPGSCDDKFEIALDSDIMDDPVIGVLSDKTMQSLKQKGYVITPVNPIEILAKQYYSNNVPEMVGKDFEEYIFRACRIFDQLLNRFTRFTTLRDVIAWKVTSPSGKSKYYIGSGKFKPVCKVDVIIADEYNLLIEDEEYSGPVFDLSYIDDLEICEFKREITDEETCNIWEKIKYVYECNGKECPITSDVLNRNKIRFKIPLTEFMALYHCATRHSSFGPDYRRFDSRLPNLNVYKSDSEFIFDSPYTPLYVGLASQWNYRGFKNFMPFLLEKLTVYGFRSLSAGESPLNLYGGPNPTGDKSNLYLYSECFQRLRDDMI